MRTGVREDPEGSVYRTGRSRGVEGKGIDLIALSSSSFTSLTHSPLHLPTHHSSITLSHRPADRGSVRWLDGAKPARFGPRPAPDVVESLAKLAAGQAQPRHGMQ